MAASKTGPRTARTEGVTAAPAATSDKPTRSRRTPRGASVAQVTETTKATRSTGSLGKVERTKPTAPAEAPRPVRPTKLVLLQNMLRAPGGATPTALGEATGWQAHTVRAALTRLRQAGHTVARERGEDGTTVYRIVADTNADAVAGLAASNDLETEGSGGIAVDGAEGQGAQR